MGSRDFLRRHIDAMDTTHHILRIALASALAAAAAAQTVWLQVPTPVAPPARTWAAIAHDTVRDRIVLWGGNDFAQWRTDTWEFDGSAWTQRTLVHAPPAARGSMAYDRGRARAVLVTGAGA